MIIETAITGGGIFIVLSQICRQLLPNSFKYFWQSHLCRVVPKRFRNADFFHDPNSLFYVSTEDFCFIKYSIFNHSNMRAVFVSFAFVVWMFSTQYIYDLQVAVSMLFRLFAALYFMSSLGLYAFRCSNGNYNPDLFIHAIFNYISFFVPFYLVLLLFSI